MLILFKFYNRFLKYYNSRKMGNDGGDIPKRRELVKQRTKV